MRGRASYHNTPPCKAMNTIISQLFLRDLSEKPWYAFKRRGRWFNAARLQGSGYGVLF